MAGFLVPGGFLALEPPVERIGDEPSWISHGVHGLAGLNHQLRPFGPRILP